MAKKSKFPFRTVLSVATVILVGVVLWQNWPDIVESVKRLPEANIFVLLLLIPEQLFMYYACGQIFFAYIKARKDMIVPSTKERVKISTELNFVNRAVPAGGIGGLAFLTFRLRPFGVSAGQASFLYIFRFAITTVFNYLQALVAIIILSVLGLVPQSATWVIWVALLMNVGVFLILALLIFVASGEKRLNYFSRFITDFGNFLVKTITFGRKKKVIKFDKVNKYFLDIHDSVVIAKKDKKKLKKSILWGVGYSLLEVATYWIVAIALGRPEILPYILVGEAIGSVFDGIVPYGLYELGMAGVMVALGVDIGTATIVTVMTRAFTLLFTIVSGAWPYRQAIMKMGKEDQDGQPSA